MIKINRIIKTEVSDKLAAIDGTTYLNGFLVHYVKDLLDDAKPDYSLPATFFRMASQDITSTNKPSMKADKQCVVTACLAVGDRETLNDRINELELTVIKALTFDEYNLKSEAVNVTVTGTTYDLPESHDSIASIDFTLSIEYTEKLTNE